MDDISERKLLSNLLDSQRVIYSRARYQSGSGDVSFSGWIPFNTIETNIGGGSWSNGAYIVPVDGLYILNFTCYSNNMTSGRIAVQNLNRGEMSMCNQNNTTSLTAIYYCYAGDRLVAGPYASNYTISFYSAAGHNSFTIARLPGGTI